MQKSTVKELLHGSAKKGFRASILEAVGADAVGDPPRKTQPKRVGDFGLRGSVCAQRVTIYSRCPLR
jgi:hypothetical protein